MSGDRDCEAYSVLLSREAAVACSPVGEILWADARAARLLGASAGMSIIDLLAEGSEEKCARFLVHASQRRAEGWELTFLVQGEPTLFECVGIPYRHDVMVVATQAPFGHSAVVADLNESLGELARLQRETQSQHRQLEALAAELARERRLLQGVLDQSPSGVRVVDPRSGTTILANEYLRRLSGVDSEADEAAAHEIELIDLSGRMYSHEEFPAARTIATGRPVTEEEGIIARPDGSQRVVRVSSAPVRDTDGNMVAVVETYHDVTALKRLQRELEHASLHDPLTGLPNRRLLFDRLSQALRSAKRRRTQVAVLFLDLDDFKGVNDSLGHLAGDEVLREIGSRLESLVRLEDSIARLAGDEFVLLLDDVLNAESVRSVASRLLAVMSDPIVVGDAQVRLTFSIGSAISGGADTPEALIERADVAMYHAKRSGKNQYQHFDDIDSELSQIPPDDASPA